MKYLSFKKRNQILERVSVIKGERFRYASRAGTTITLGFGEDAPSETFGCRDASGLYIPTPCTTPRYTLHIECIFSINRKERILLSQDDLLKPSKNFKKSRKNLEEEPDKIGNTRYNEITAKHSVKLGYGETVTDVSVTKFGDLVIEMTKGFYLLVIPYRKDGDEAWRFFDYSEKRGHFVVGYCKIMEF